MRNIILLLLSPILIIQGIWVRTRTVRLPEPDGQRSGKSGSGESLRLLILGDSAAAGVGVNSQEKALTGQVVSRLSTRFNLHWHLDAKTGRTTYDTLQVLKSRQAENYDVVLISLGVNDVTSRIAVLDWLEHCSDLAEILKDKFSAKRIIWSDLPKMEKFTALPQPLRWVVGQRKDHLRNALANWIRHQESVELLEFPNIFESSENKPREKIEDWIASDGYHPGEKIYVLWAEQFMQHLYIND